MAKPKKPPKKGTVYINGKPVTQEQWASGEFLKALVGPKAADAVQSKPAPTAPAKVDPFMTADDIDALNAFTSDLATKLEDIRNVAGDYDEATGTWKGGTLETDTKFQKTGLESQAKEAGASATEDAIARGIFSSSVKDASLYDIEAQRALSSKFLDDQLTSARLNAGTNKKILGDAKVAFDTNMQTRMVGNATGVNDTNSSAWADAMAAWEANPTNQAAAVQAAPGIKAPPKTAPQKGLGTPAPLGAKPAKPRPANQSSTKSGSVKPRKPRKVYG